jgi:hypothetical protein
MIPFATPARHADADLHSKRTRRIRTSVPYGNRSLAPAACVTSRHGGSIMGTTSTVLAPQAGAGRAAVQVRWNRKLGQLLRDASANRDAVTSEDVVRLLKSFDLAAAETLGRQALRPPVLRPPIRIDPGKLHIDMWILLDFDTDGEGRAIADGTLADGLYGLPMTNPLGNGKVYVRAAGNPSIGKTNVISIFAPGTAPFFHAQDGAIDVVFDRPTEAVKIDAYPVCETQCPETPTYCTGRPFLEAYDEAGKYLGKALYPGCLPGISGGDGWQTINLTLPTRSIKRVRFSCQQDGCATPNKAWFDNLRYHFTL